MYQPSDIERQNIVQTVFGEDLVQHTSSSRFESYFEHYCSIVCPSAPGDAVIQLDTPVLRTHTDVTDCVRLLVQDPKVSFDEFVAKTVDQKSEGASLREKRHVARVAVEVPFAVNCTFGDHYSDNFSQGFYKHFKWDGDVSFLDFMENAFTVGIEKVQSTEEQWNNTEMMAKKASLKAWKLTNRYGIHIRGTDNILEHLMFDAKSKTLKVFHQVAFIRAHLEKSKHESLDLSFEQSLRRGTLPPRLLLETLLTFHDVLFPVASIREKRSSASLENMIQKHGFDAEGRWVGFVRDTPVDMTFDYWGGRLSVLHNIVKQPPPANAIVAWVERHTSERNALTVAIARMLRRKLSEVRAGFPMLGKNTIRSLWVFVESYDDFPKAMLQPPHH
ncbi:hypothetical protein SLS62_007746 [Diatrype stigma]|uniref:Uncharacterized protein n=1 Tax=Diatrype stigma TaxID=117547 RepID=A0AAN9UYT7_9PEZI